jgi:glyoxylase-like metal-dependent hydrolase (beta-lactamase superfamily II)
MSASSGSGQEVRVGPAGDAGEQADAQALATREIVCVRAENPGALTLTGTNTWVLGRDPAWVVDPGPLLDSHLRGVLDAIEERGGLGGIALTHDHHDHAEAVAALRERHPAPLAAGRGEADVALAGGIRIGPLEAVATPGHAADHFAFVGAGACFTGDAVLGAGSVFVSPEPGAMAGYLHGLERLRTRDDFDVLCPGHGPPVWEAHAKLEEYVVHRLDRENRLIAALAEGRRTARDLLDAVWSDVPEPLRGAAAATLAAHLDKLEEEEALPPGVERPRFEHVRW